MRVNRRQLSVITKVDPPRPDPMGAVMAKLAEIEAMVEMTRLAVPLPQPGYDDRSLMQRLEAIERAIVAVAAVPMKFTFDVIRNDKGQIDKILVERPGRKPDVLWRK
jgi:hypothetical protein